MRIRRRNKGERASALAAVLCLVFTGSLIVMMVLVMSQYGMTTVGAHTELQKSVYINEGVGNRVQFLISAERAKNPSVNLFDVDYSDGEMYLPDGVEHTMDYHGNAVKFTITDARSGVDLSPSYFRTTISALKRYSETDTEFIEQLDKISDILADYNDIDDLTSTNGRESSEYDELSAGPLPRNERMTFREELFYIPEVLALLPPDQDGRLSGIRLISTTGNVAGYSSSLFTASDLEIKARMNLEDADLATLKDALKQYKTDQTRLSDILSSEMLSNIRRSGFISSPGNVYTVKVETAEKRLSRKLVFTFQASPVSGPDDSTVKYLEYLNY